MKAAYSIERCLCAPYITLLKKYLWKLRHICIWYVLACAFAL